MTARTSPGRFDASAALWVLDRLAPAPPRDVVATHVERGTDPGDVVLDLHGRGGWVARAAIDRRRRAISLESSPLTRLLAELVLRPIPTPAPAEPPPDREGPAEDDPSMLF